MTLFLQFQPQLTVFNAASPNNLSSFLSDTTAAVFLFDSLQASPQVKECACHTRHRLTCLLQSPLEHQAKETDHTFISQGLTATGLRLYILTSYSSRHSLEDLTFTRATFTHSLPKSIEMTAAFDIDADQQHANRHRETALQSMFADDKTVTKLTDLLDPSRVVSSAVEYTWLWLRLCQKFIGPHNFKRGFP